MEVFYLRIIVLSYTKRVIIYYFKVFYGFFVKIIIFKRNFEILNFRGGKLG